MYIWLIFDKYLMRRYNYKENSKYKNTNEILEKYIFHLGNYITENDSLRDNLIDYFNTLPPHLQTVSSKRLKDLHEKAKAASQEKAKVLPKNILSKTSSQKSIKREEEKSRTPTPKTQRLIKEQPRTPPTTLTKQGGKRKYKMSRKNKKIQKKNITIKKRR